MMLVKLLVLGIIIPNAYGACSDLLTKQSTLTFGGTNYTKCSKLVKQHPIACQQAAIGGEDGFCCASCEALGNCYDALTKKSILTLKTSVINTKKTKTIKFKNCETVLNDFPGLCKDEYDADGTFQNYCCESCSSAPANVDAPVLFKDGNDFIVCRDYVAKYPCDCSIPIVQDRCSVSCAGIDPIALDCCEDLLASWYKVKVKYWGSLKQKVTIKDCEQLTEYPLDGLCLQKQFSDPAGLCCETCSEIDTDCLDVLNTKPVKFNGNKYDSCALLVEDQPCSCDQPSIAGACCHSCETADLSECDCTDQSGWTFTFSITGDNHCNLPTTPLTCGDIAADYPVLCNEYGGDGNPCCESCKGIGAPQDELFCFGRAGTYYTCSDLIAARTCECTDSDVASKCLLSCDGVDTSGCDCQDLLGWTTTSATLTITNASGQTSSIVYTNCADVLADGYCSTFGGIGGPCCETCS